ncbi:MAG: hypothetical protein QW587_04525 [Candidatus Bathyarchaeia archaeon]
MVDIALPLSTFEIGIIRAGYFLPPVFLVLLRGALAAIQIETGHRIETSSEILEELAVEAQGIDRCSPGV